MSNMNDKAEQTVQALPRQDKKRYEWIDNARIIAAFLIVLNHLLGAAHFGGDFGSAYVKDWVLDSTLNGRVPMFLILAGYFLSRNITWKKAWDRFLWLLIPFVIWNSLYCYGIRQYAFSIPGFFSQILGINAIIHPDLFKIFGNDWPCTPINSPSWFLRDIIFLSLLAPVIVKFRKAIPAALIICISISFMGRTVDSGALFSCSTVFFFSLGVYLSQFRIYEAERVFTKSFTYIVAAGMAVTTALVTLIHLCHITQIGNMSIVGHISTLPGMVFGAMMICHGGVLIEKYLPRLSKKMAPCGPACFLVFMLHFPIILLLGRVMPPQLWNSWWVLLMVPVPLFTCIVLFFLAMKKYTPWLMPYLGHMKVQKPKPAPAPEAKPAA